METVLSCLLCVIELWGNVDFTECSLRSGDVSVVSELLVMRQLSSSLDQCVGKFRRIDTTDSNLSVVSRWSLRTVIY